MQSSALTRLPRPGSVLQTVPGLARRPSRRMARRICVSPRALQQLTPPVARSPGDNTADPSVEDPRATHPGAPADCDYVVIGSGVGGLCAAALLAKGGHRVTVCEAHWVPGGVLQGFERQGYHFDGGANVFWGLNGPRGKFMNPVKDVLEAIGEVVPVVNFSHSCRFLLPEDKFDIVWGEGIVRQDLERLAGPGAQAEWERLIQELMPMREICRGLPVTALRYDAGILLTSRHHLPSLLAHVMQQRRLTGPFSELMDKVVANEWLRDFLNFEAYQFTGMGAADCSCSVMAQVLTEMALAEWPLEYPIGGSKAIADALVRGVEKFGGQVLLRSPVDHIIMDGDRAAGVQLKAGKLGAKPQVIRARKAVISNASLWDTARLLPPDAAHELNEEALGVPWSGSFLHLHLGIDASGLPPDLPATIAVVDSLKHPEAPMSMRALHIPTQLDPSMAPAGKATVHAFTSCTEPFEIWESLARNSREYKQLKEERAEALWQAVERVIPDVRQRVEVAMVGTPLTHQRILHKFRGAFGATLSTRLGTLPTATSPVKGLYRCGDSCFPGVGVPCAAASGVLTANTLSSLPSHLSLVAELGL